MEVVLVTLLIALGGGTFMLPLIIGFSKTPPGSVFLGMTHHPPDYYYYLSQFTLGKERWFWGQDLFTTEFHQDTLVGWVNVFLGKLFSLVHIPPLWAFHISALISTILLLFVVYRIIMKLFPNTHMLSMRMTTFVLFLIGNILPTFPVTSDTIVQNSFWQNFTEPLVRFGSVPHQIIGQVCIGVLFLLTQTDMLSKRIPLKLSLLALCGLLLASINPVQWMFTLGILMVASVITLLRSGHTKTNFTIKLILLLVPLVVIAVSGLPIAFYIQNHFTVTPYVQLRDWEAAQQIRLTLWGIILSQGPLFLGALLGVTLFLRRKDTLSLSLLLYTVCSLLLFVSPIPMLIKISNVRFLSGIIVLTYAAMATTLLESLPRHVRIYGSVCMISLFLVLSLPLFSLQFQSKVAYTPTNAYIYISQDVMDIFQKAHTISSLDDNFFVDWPYNISFPAVVARHVYNGHPLLTIDPSTKDLNAWKFTSKQMSESQMRAFLMENNIRYIIGTPYEYASYQSLSISLVEQKNAAALYKVHLQ
jgi:hypothetical protein